MLRHEPDVILDAEKSTHDRARRNNLKRVARRGASGLNVESIRSVGCLASSVTRTRPYCNQSRQGECVEQFHARGVAKRCGDLLFIHIDMLHTAAALLAMLTAGTVHEDSPASPRKRRRRNAHVLPAGLRLGAEPEPRFADERGGV